MRSLLYNLLGKLASTPANNALRVLAYHTVPDSSIFRKQLIYLKENFNIISIDQLKEFLFYSKELPSNALLITFDDGDISVYKNGYPELKSLDLPSAMFIITELVDSDKMFWCRRVEKVFEKQGKSYSDARIKVNKLKKVPELDRRKFINEIENLDADQLNSNQIKELNDNQMFIGNHTHTHPMINICTDYQIIEEMDAARSKFDSLNILENYSVFAYPNGNWEPKSENVLKKQGIKMGFLFDHQLNEEVNKINPMRISRIRVNADDDLSEFKVKVSGLHSKILNIRQKLGR